MAKTMKKEDVLFPARGSTKKMIPGVFGALLPAVKNEIFNAVGEDVDNSKWSAAEKAIKPFKGSDAKKKYEEVYWKVGYIGNDLYFRIKSQKKGIRGATGHSHDDTLLMKSAKTLAKKNGKGDNANDDKAKDKPKKSSSKEQVINLPTYILWDKSRSTKIMQQQGFVDAIGGQAKCKLSLTLPGGLEKRAIDECKKIAITVLDELHDELTDAIDNKLQTLLMSSGGDEAKLKKIASSTGTAVNKLCEPRTVEMLVAERCDKYLATDKQFKALNTEFKVKAGFSITSKSIGAAIQVAKLVFSAGADVSAYYSLAKTAYGLYQIIDDLTKKEAELRETLLQSIKDYKGASEVSIKSIQARYQEALADNEGSMFAKAKSALAAKDSALAQAKQKLNDAAVKLVQQKLNKTIASLIPSPDQPEADRKRYITGVGGDMKKLDAQYKKLLKELDKFKGARLDKAVKLWQMQKPLKAAYAKASNNLKESLLFAAGVKVEIEKMGIKTSDNTSIDNIKQIAKAIKERDPAKGAPGAKDLYDSATELKGIFDGIKELAETIADGLS